MRILCFLHFIEGTDVKEALDQALKEIDRALEIANRAKKNNREY